MTCSMAGKVVLVTGGAGSLGRAFIERFLTAGCKVCLCDVNSEVGQSYADQLAAEHGADKIKFTHCDVTSDESVKGAFADCKETFGGLDILVNNAGVANEKDFKQTIDVNLFGSIRGTEEAIRHMSKETGNNGGRVVNISSISGLKNLPFGPYYSTSKSGIVHYTRVIGHQFHFGYTGVVVQCLCPSLVDTPFIHVTSKNSYNPQSEAAIKSLFGKIPLLDTSEVADALFALLDDNKPGAVMVLEKGKPPYYVEPSVV